MDTPAPVNDHLARQSRGRGLPRNVYPIRALGTVAGFLPVATVMREMDAPILAWVVTIFYAVVWPQIAFLVARGSEDPWRAERRNLVVDATLCGIWVPLMGFNVLPSVLIVSMMSLGLLSVGGPRFLTETWASMLAAGVVAFLVIEPAIRPQTSFAVVVASLPLIVLYPTSIGIASYVLRHRIRMQRLQLDRLNRTERLSGLTTRQHWEEALEAELERCRRTGATAGLILVDLDDFKAVNDRFGHLAGDEVIRSMGEALRQGMRPADVACRYGGDEFGVLVPDSDAAGAALAAERVRESFERIRFSLAPELRCTSSIGVAQMGPATADPREVIALADRALYLAKAAGRNRVHCLEE